MLDVNDDQVMTDFLLGRLDNETREQIFDRLGADAEYFERMAALEDDLMLHGLRGELTPESAALFSRVYETPAQRARLDAARALLAAAEAWKAEQANGVWARIQAWLPALPPLPRFALVGATIALVGLAVGWLALRPDTSNSHTYALTLAAVSEKGTPDAGFDNAELPPGTRLIALTVVLSRVSDAAQLSVQIVDRDRGTVLTAEPQRVSATDTTTTVMVTLQASSLPDGDYVLTVHEQGVAERAATQAFRVTRLRD